MDKVPTYAIFSNKYLYSFLIKINLVLNFFKLSIINFCFKLSGKIKVKFAFLFFAYKIFGNVSKTQ